VPVFCELQAADKQVGAERSEAQSKRIAHTRRPNGVQMAWSYGQAIRGGPLGFAALSTNLRF